MKNSKIVAAMAAAALTVSMMAVPVFADTTFTKDSEGAFVFDNLDVLSDEDAVIVVTYTDANDNWGDIGFGFSEGEEWRSWAGVNPAGEEATVEYSVADIVAGAKIEDINAVTFGKVEGWNGCEILNVEVKAASDDVDTGDDVDTTDAETTDGETTDAETTGEDDYTTGDLDGNGVINVNDIVKLAAHIKGKRMLSAAAIKAADVNGDGKLDINDLVKIAAHVKGKRLLY